MTYIIVINAILIIWLYIKYIYTPKITQSCQENLKELDAALIGYINNENGKNVDWLLAEILELNRKGYIDIVNEKEDINKYDYKFIAKIGKDLSKLKKYELTAYRYLFDEFYILENEYMVTMNELEEKILKSSLEENSVNAKLVNLRNEIEEELINIGIISVKLKKYRKPITNLVVLVGLIISIVAGYLQMYELVLLFIEIVCALLILYRGKPFTKKGKIVAEQLNDYVEQLKENEILKEKKIAHYVLLDKEYINSIALNIMSEARKEFIGDELDKIVIRRTAKDMKLIRLAIILILLVLIYLIMQSTTVRVLICIIIYAVMFINSENVER